MMGRILNCISWVIILVLAIGLFVGEAHALYLPGYLDDQLIEEAIELGNMYKEEVTNDLLLCDNNYRIMLNSNVGIDIYSPYIQIACLAREMARMDKRPSSSHIKDILTREYIIVNAFILEESNSDITLDELSSKLSFLFPAISNGDIQDRVLMQITLWPISDDLERERRFLPVLKNKSYINKTDIKLSSLNYFWLGGLQTINGRFDFTIQVVLSPYWNPIDIDFSKIK